MLFLRVSPVAPFPDIQKCKPIDRQAPKAIETQMWVSCLYPDG